LIPIIDFSSFAIRTYNGLSFQCAPQNISTKMYINHFVEFETKLFQDYFFFFFCSHYFVSVRYFLIDLLFKMIHHTRIL
jgi:hypothetical protein